MDQGTQQLVAVAQVEILPGVLIPRGIQPLLQSSWNVVTSSEEWERPRTVTPEQKAFTRRMLVEIRQSHIPAPTERLKNRLQAFLGHWFQLDDSALEGRYVDWMRCLSEFSLRAVDRACTDYLSSTEKRPCISALRALCQKHDEHLRLIKRLDVIVSSVPVIEAPEPPDESSRLRVGAWLAVARSQGMALTSEQMTSFERGEMP